ncbi:DNA polymerase [Herbidospora galbida]|uniref:DNA polymerase n=1 Tax=Herbidospora galbida TaxID=2575442 RepID=UPI001484E22E|nr:DNA polymerase [Herbidospora galbida]
MFPSSTILTEGQLDDVVSYLKRQDAFAFDVETTGDHRGVPTQNEVTWLSLASHGMAVAIPMGHPIGDKIIGEEKIPKVGKDGKTRHYRHPIWEPPPPQLRRHVVFEKLWPLFNSPDHTKVAHNLPFDVISTAKYLPAPAAPPYADTRQIAWLLDENERTGLKPTTKRVYRVDYDKEGVGKCVEKFPFSKVAEYARLDSKFTWLLYRRWRDAIAHERLDDAQRMENDLLEQVIIDMLSHGAPVLVPWLQQLRVDLAIEVEEREAAVYAAAGQLFNVGSSQQKANILFGPKAEGCQGLRPKKLTDGGEKKAKRGEPLLITDYSTDADTLKEYPSNKVAQAILRYQESVKLLSTYVDGYLGIEDDPKKPCIIFESETGPRVYTTLDPHGTVTGRWSSYGPNLQNIPTRSESGKKIRGIYTAPDGWKLVVGDLGQIELVVLAHFAGGGKLFEGFHEGHDPHTITAAAIFGVPLDQVTKEQRTIGKTINFAIVFGAGPKTVATQAGISLTFAKQMLAEHGQQFPEVHKLKAKILKVARSRGPVPFIRTLIGRKRRLRDLNSYDSEYRSRAERQAVNSLIQGSAADLIKLAMIRIRRALRERGLDDSARLILTIHDELVIEARDEVADMVAELLRDAMIGPGIQERISVPLTVDIHIVQSWNEAK